MLVASAVARGREIATFRTIEMQTVELRRGPGFPLIGGVTLHYNSPGQIYC